MGVAESSDRATHRAKPIGRRGGGCRLANANAARLAATPFRAAGMASRDPVR